MHMVREHRSHMDDLAAFASWAVTERKTK